MGWLESVWGSKPEVAKPTYTDLGKEQKKSIEENIGSFAESAKLGDLYSEYLQGGIEKQLPGFAALGKSSVGVTQTLENQAGQLARGEIPQDVQDLVRRTDAYQSLMSGTAGSGMARALTARDFGRTSLDLINQGAALNAAAGNSAQLWDRIASGTLYDPSRNFVTPAQQEAVTAKNNELRQAFQQAKFNVAAAPSPIAKGVSDTLIGLISAYLSKGGGGTSANQPANPYSTSVVGHTGGFMGFGGENIYGSEALPYDNFGGGGGGYQPLPESSYSTIDYGK